MKLNGLNNEEIQLSREKNGSNIIPDAQPKQFWDEFKETFQDPMIKILLFIVVLMLGMYTIGYAEIYEPVGTIIAILIVATVTAKTGVASDSKYREIKNNTKKDQCKVYRNGNMVLIDIGDIVVSDLVLLQSGDKVPADGIIIDGKLSVDNSALNGETDECYKTAADDTFVFTDKITGDTFVDSHSVFRGCVVIDGTGVLEVKSVGVKTMMGEMAQEMQSEDVDSPLKVKLTKLAEQISMFGYIGAIVISIIYMLVFISNAGGLTMYLDLGWHVIINHLVEALSIAVVIVVCAVPEGLPLMISLVLMQNTSKMLDHNVLVRKAEGIETAGSLNILFSDKTGTITKGELEVVTFFTGDGNESDLATLKSNDKLNVVLSQNTDSMFDIEGNVIGGNSTEQALLKFLGCEKHNEIHSQLSVNGKQGFNSTNKFSQVEVDGVTYYKGAPEKILEKATKYIDAKGNVKDIDHSVVEEKIMEIANKAMRVLAFSYIEESLEHDQIHQDSILIGMVGIRDEIRPEARNAIEEVKKAGIQVVMITGDRQETAIAIAKESGLITGESDVIITSEELNKMTDDEVKEIVSDLRVISRALPTDKSRLVRLCQELNLVVGMTGDGVNDSPALKRADVGFAMGSGTDAAKEASKIVILNDDFQSIKDAILYGRTIYHNILKFCKFQLVINVTAVFVSAFAPLLGIEEPLKVTHLLFVNLVMDGLGAIMLGNEPALKEYMLELPRKRDESIISKTMRNQILVVGGWMTFISFAYLKSPLVHQLFDGNDAKIKSSYFVLFIVAALFNGFNVRDDGFKIFSGLEKNKGFMQVFIAIIVIQALIINVQLIPVPLFIWIGNMFSCVPFKIQGWLLVFAIAFTIIPVDLIRKSVIKLQGSHS